MLDPDLKKKWVAALRSGEYAQGVCHLKKYRDGEFEYCCLGVLSVVNGDTFVQYPEKDLQNNIDLYFVKEDLEKHVGDFRRNRHVATCSQPYYDELGLDSYVVNYLWSMNDTGAAFSEIADYIEQNEDI